MGLNIPVPSYSQISRRAKSLHKRIKYLIQGGKARHLIFDSTGLKVHGEGEWKIKVHGKAKRRMWRKFHIGIGWEKERDAAIAAIHGFGGDEIGRKLWKICSGYHERSLVETAMFRVKKMFGDKLKARSMGAQRTEAICKCMIINKMNKLGMPKFEWVFEAA